MNNRLKPYATVGTVSGLLQKFRDEQYFPPKSAYWISRVDNQAQAYICSLPTLQFGDYAEMQVTLDRFFTEVFEKGKSKHLMTFIEFFIGILDDLGDRSDRMKKLIDTLMRTRTALTQQFAEWPACTVAGARIADKWGEMWNDLDRRKR